MNNDFAYGLVGGVVGTGLSHPFDTLKTRIQSSKASSISDAFKMGKLYSGLTPPLLGIALEKSIVFGFYNLAKQNGLNNFTSGLFGGFMSTVVVVPVDRLKIIMQNKGTITKEILKPSSLYKGFSITLFRETPGFGIYFTTYNYLADKYNKESNLAKTFIFGSLSGLNSWIFIYPSDLIKTKYQSVCKITNPTESNIPNVIKSIYKLDGIKGYYKGFNLAIMRALPLHGGVFLGYELSKKIF
jgi:solute carrier family 25 carnitine/acylcarnitine transporter 20/29